MCSDDSVSLVLLGGRLATSQSTGSTRSDQTDLATVRSISSDGRGLTDVLVVTTTVRMLDWVHGHTTHLRPVVALHLVLVVGTASLQHRLVHTTTAGDQADHCTVARADHLLRAGRQLDSSSVRVGVVGDHGGAVARRSGQLATVAELLFDVADRRTLRQTADRQNVADLQAGSLTARDRLTGVHAFGGDEQLLSQAILVRVAEGDNGQRCTPARVVDDLLCAEEVRESVVSGSRSSGPKWRSLGQERFSATASEVHHVVIRGQKSSSIWTGSPSWSPVSGQATYFNDSFEKTVSLGEVERSQFRRAFASSVVRSEDRTLTFGAGEREETGN